MRLSPLLVLIIFGLTHVARWMPICTGRQVNNNYDDDDDVELNQY